MANINIRVEDELKINALATFKDLGIAPSDAVRTFLEYVVQNKRMPIKQVLVSDEDADLYDLVKKRINEPQKFKETTLNDLFNKGS